MACKFLGFLKENRGFVSIRGFYNFAFLINYFPISASPSVFLMVPPPRVVPPLGWGLRDPGLRCPATPRVKAWLFALAWLWLNLALAWPNWLGLASIGLLWRILLNWLGLILA